MTALEHQLNLKNQAERQLRQTMAGLQHEIQLGDQTISILHQQMHQMDATLKHQAEVNKQATRSAHQQFNQHFKALENQMKAREQALEVQIQANDREKVELEQKLCQKEEQIQARDREKTESEQQLHQKEEQIQSKEKERAELEQRLRQKEEHGPPEMTQVAEMQQKWSVHAAAQGEIPSVQLLESREEVRTKEEELRQVKEELSQMKEEHEIELSRLTNESTRKQQKVEFELKAQIVQADALRDELQQQLKAKDIQVTAISRESQHRIDTLTNENKEVTAKINSLEAKLVKLEFLEGVSSQEVDQLREELIDKEVEIDYLRKEQALTTPTTTATSSPLPHLRGAEVVAETTFTLTPEQQSFEFIGYGFKLHVPEDSLPVELSEAQLTVRVSLSGQFKLPPNCELVSAVYWVFSPYKFTKPLVVEIQHCAALSSDEQCEQLTFVRTVCTQKELPYTFTEEGGVFSYHSSYGSLSLTHFSGVGVGRRRGCKVHRPHRAQPAPYRVQPVLSASKGTIQVQPPQPASDQCTDTVPSELSLDSQRNIEGSEQDKVFDQYCGQVYIKRGVNDCRVYFVITRNLDAHRTVVREFYSAKMQAKEDIEMALEFGEDNCISLAVPRSGIVLQSDWKIIPRYNPMIKKGNVDHFSCGQMIPKGELLLRWPHRGKPHVCLEHDIELTGAKGGSYFTLYVPDEDTPIPSPVTIDGELVSPTSTVSSPRDLSIKYAGLESEPELSDLMNEVASKVSAKWKQISIQLGLTPNDEECFMASTPSDTIQCITSVFKVWKKRAQKPYTWSTVIEALNAPAVDEMRLAHELTTKLQYYSLSPMTTSN